MHRLFPAALASAVGFVLIPTGVALAATAPTAEVDVDLCVAVDAAIDTGDTRLVDLDTGLRARVTAALDAVDDLTDTTALADVRVDLGCVTPAAEPEPTTTTPAPTAEPTTTSPPSTTTPTTAPSGNTAPDSDPGTGRDTDRGYSQLDDIPSAAAETGGGPA